MILIMFTQPSIKYLLDNFYLQRNGGTGKLNSFLNTNHLIQGSAEIKPLRVRFFFQFSDFWHCMFTEFTGIFPFKIVMEGKGEINLDQFFFFTLEAPYH